MTRYFPEVVEAVKASFPERAVIDGEIVIASDGGLDFQALQQRIHPAASRVERLAAETPASFIAFDLLALGDEDLTQAPFEQRRAALERALAGARPPVHVTPVTRGTRLCSFFWIQSMIRRDSHRGLLFELDQATQRVGAEKPGSPAAVQLAGVYHNLIREWAEV